MSSKFRSLERLLNSPPRISSQFGPPDDLVHLLAGDQAARSCGRRRLHFRRTLQVTVVERERLVVVVNLRQIGVGENLHQQLPPAPLPRLYGPITLTDPATVPLVLVLPFLGIADPGFGLDVVEPRVFHAGPAGPDILASDRTGVATDALVQVQHHADLGSYFHKASCRAAPKVAYAPSGGNERM